MWAWKCSASSANWNKNNLTFSICTKINKESIFKYWLAWRNYWSVSYYFIWITSESRKQIHKWWSRHQISIKWFLGYDKKSLVKNLKHRKVALLPNLMSPTFWLRCIFNWAEISPHTCVIALCTEHKVEPQIFWSRYNLNFYAPVRYINRFLINFPTIHRLNLIKSHNLNILFMRLQNSLVPLLSELLHFW